MRELTLAVVGIDHPNADKSRSSRRMEMLMCRPGDPVELRAEPKNPHDPHAVAVWSERGVQLGYVRAERAPLVARRLAEGAAAVFQGMEGPVGYVRARFGGGAPTLPAGAHGADGPATANTDPDLWPDPEGPEFGA